MGVGALTAACGQGTATTAQPPEAPRLRVCADPNNLPFSNARGEGFENELAQMIAADRGEVVAYTWLPQRRGFIRNTLKARLCDVVMGLPAGFELAATTRPYYRSAYAFVTRADRRLELEGLDDPRLRALRIGLHAIGDDYANVPPAQALAARGLADRIVGFSIYGDYSRPNPPAALVEAVARGEIDVAIAWGPLAGYVAGRSDEPLRVAPIASAEPGMQFAIAMGVRRGDDALRAALDEAIVRRRSDIAGLLDRYGVPRLALQEDPR